MTPPTNPAIALPKGSPSPKTKTDAAAALTSAAAAPREIPGDELVAGSPRDDNDDFHFPYCVVSPPSFDVPLVPRDTTETRRPARRDFARPDFWEAKLNRPWCAHIGFATAAPMGGTPIAIELGTAKQPGVPAKSRARM